MAHTGAAGARAGAAGLVRRNVVRFAIAGLVLAHSASLSSDPATELSRATAWAARASLDARTRAALERTLALALLKLDSPKCQEIFREFRDSTARPLEERLAAAGRDRRALLDGISFRNGSGYMTCLDNRVLAWTHPGDTVIYLSLAPRSLTER